MTNNNQKNTLIVLLLGALMTVSPFAIDMYLPAFKEIAKDFGTTTSKISLSLSSYFIGVSIGQLLYGPLLDRYGRKKPLYIGLGIYLIACICCMLSTNVESLVGFRFIQALGGCVALVAAMAMVRDFFPVEQSPKIISLMMLILGLSPLLAPTIGGFISVWLGWRWVFVVLLIITGIILLLIMIFLPEGHKPDLSVSLRVKPMLETFVSIIKNPQFYTYAISGSFSFGCIMIYVAGSPIIFLDIFHVSPKVYSLIFALLSIGFIGSNQLNIFLLKKYKTERIFKSAVTLQMILAVILLVCTLNNWLGLISTIALLFVFLTCMGLTYPNASALALAPFTKNAGSASALLGFLQIGTGGLLSGLISLFKGSSSLPVVAMWTGASLIAVLILLAGKKSASILSAANEAI
jgi:DHA1 family bicyclomycin/chloramphenicol resistance-like MFS transporter